MRDYPKAIEIGEAFLKTLKDANKNIQEGKSSKKLSSATETTTETDLHYLLGHTAWEDAETTGNYTKVKEHYLRGLELEPMYPAGNGEDSNLAMIRVIEAIYMKEGQYEEAISRFEITIKSYPGSGYNFLTLVWYADALEEYGDHLTEQARQKDEEAKLPGSSASLKTDAVKLRKKAEGMYKEAVLRYERAQKSRPDAKYVDTLNKQYLIQVVFSQGYSAFKAGDYRPAEEYLRDALEEYGQSKVAQKYLPEAIEKLGDINALLGNYQQAIGHYQDYLDRSFEDPDLVVSMKLADAYLKQMSFDRAREHYRKILKNDPPPSEDEVKRRIIQGLENKQGPGFIAMKKIAESFHSEARFAIEDERQQKLEATLAAYEELESKFPVKLDIDKKPYLVNDPDSLQKIAIIHYELGYFKPAHYIQAAANYEEFLRMAPNYQRKGPVLKRIADCYKEMQDYDKVIEKLDNVNVGMMDNPDQYADILMLQGQANQFKANASTSDPALYQYYLDQAKNYYSKVMAPEYSAQKRKEARTMRDAIAVTN